MRKPAKVLLSMAIAFLFFIQAGGARAIEPAVYWEDPEGKQKPVYTFTGLNPIIDVEGCPELYTIAQAYRNLTLRGIPLLECYRDRLNGRDAFVISLDTGERFALDCLEYIGEHDDCCFILEETVCQFCYYYFGENYDFLSTEPEDWR